MPFPIPIRRLAMENRPMSFQKKLLEEIEAIGVTALFFAIWFVTIIVLERLVLAQYDIEFRGLSVALISALVVAKVVVLMEHVSLGQWVQRKPVAVDITLRLFLYTGGTFLVFWLEKAFEKRHEGGFGHDRLDNTRNRQRKGRPLRTPV